MNKKKHKEPKGFYKLLSWLKSIISDNLLLQAIIQCIVLTFSFFRIDNYIVNVTVLTIYILLYQWNIRDQR